MLLADMGADVVKVEGPAGDDTRTWTPPERDGEATYYLGINRGKRSIALDLRDEATSPRPGSSPAAPTSSSRTCGPAGWPGSGWTTRASPRPTPVSSTPRSPGSAPAPGAHVPGYDLMVQAMSGLMSLTGDPDGPPFRAGISVFDVMAGNHAAIGILAALRHRDRTGRASTSRSTCCPRR
jgi:hypothetical protein